MLTIKRFKVGNYISVLMNSENITGVNDMNASAKFNKLYMHDLGMRF